MAASTSFMQVATLANALGWPLAAGVAVVAWSRIRAAAHARRVADTERRLRDHYRRLEDRPVPPRLMQTVEALQEGEELTSRTERETSAGS